MDLSASVDGVGPGRDRGRRLQHFEELIALVPNMNFSGDGARARYFQLRGIGELEQYEGAPNPSVGFIVDDIDLSGVGGVNPVFDLGAGGGAARPAGHPVRSQRAGRYGLPAVR